MFVHEANELWQSSVPLAHSSISTKKNEKEEEEEEEEGKGTFNSTFGLFCFIPFYLLKSPEMGIRYKLFKSLPCDFVITVHGECNIS